MAKKKQKHQMMHVYTSPILIQFLEVHLTHWDDKYSKKLCPCVLSPVESIIQRFCEDLQIKIVITEKTIC